MNRKPKNQLLKTGNRKQITTVLVTGGGGYLGAVLVPKLLSVGYHVTVLDVFLYGDVLPKHRNLRIVKGDIRDRGVIGEILRGVESVIHLACISNDPSFEMDPQLGKSVNYDATIQLIDLAKRAGVTRFIYASSSSVYGVKKEKNVTEDLPLEPLTDYSKYKALCEAYLLQQQTNNFTTVVLRPATVCGYSPRMRLDLTVNILSMSALVHKKIIVHGGSQKRPNIHIEDMADIYIKMPEYPKEKIAGQIFNVGYQNYTIMELARMVQRVLGDSSIVIEANKTNDVRSYQISSEKIKRELNFVPRHCIEEAIGDIKKAHNKGLLPNALTEARYYNIRMMKTIA